MGGGWRRRGAAREGGMKVIQEQEAHRLAGEAAPITSVTGNSFWFQVSTGHIDWGRVRFSISLSETKGYTLINNDKITKQETLT